MPLHLSHFVPYASKSAALLVLLFVAVQFRGRFLLEDGLNAASA